MQNPRRKLDDKCFMFIICVRFCSCLCEVCSHVSEVLLLALGTSSLTKSSDSKLRAFLRFIAFSGSPTAVHTVYRMHYGITLWAYLSEPLSHKCLVSLTEKPQYRVLKSLDHTLPLCTCYGEVYRNIACEENG